jgi:hypothetical protein
VIPHLIEDDLLDACWYWITLLLYNLNQHVFLVKLKEFLSTFMGMTEAEIKICIS